MGELIILQPIRDIFLEPQKEISNYKRRIVRRSYEREDSLEMFDKFKKFSKLKSLNVLDPFEHLGETEVEFIDFILKERIRKELNYKFLVDLGDGFYLLVLPECPHEFIYKTMIFFKSNLEMLEKDMIRFINKKKDEIFNHFQLKSRVSIDCKIEKNKDLIKSFINLFSISKNDLHQISFGTANRSSQPLRDLEVLIGDKKIYISIEGNPSDLEFLLFVKEYYNRF